jgi:hypothetical protein
MDEQRVYEVSGHLIERRLLWVAESWVVRAEMIATAGRDWHPTLGVFREGGGWGAKCNVYVKATSLHDAVAQAKTLFEQQSSEVG